MKALWRSLKQSKTGMIGLAIVLVVVVCAIFAYQLAPCDPLQQDLMNKLHDPAWTATGTPEHLLGTDQLGRDVLSRLLVGARITLLVALAGTVVGGVVGVVLGCLAGYYGGWVDAVLMRLVDIQLCFPFTLLALFIAAVLGGSLGNVILIAGITSWVRYARLVRGEILSIKESEYIEAIPTWGRMLSEARANMVSNPWQCILPGLCITLTVLGVNLLGDWLRDYLDPKLDV